MQEIIQGIITVGSTPTNSFDIPFTKSQIKDIEIIYTQSGKQKIIKRKDDIELSDYNAKVKLSQDDTFSLNTNQKVRIQSRVKDLKDDVLMSEQLVVSVEDCLFDEVF